MTPYQAIRPLPARAAPLPGESLTSLMRRTAETMGYDSMARVVFLLAERGRLPPQLNQLLPGRVVDYLAALFRQPPEAVSSLTVHRYAPSLVLVPEDQPPAKACDSKTIRRCFSSSWPVCPACLGQDQVPYERLVWSFRPISVCVEHGCFLISRCPACRRPLRPDRQDVSHCRCGQCLSAVEPVAISTCGLLLSRKLHQILLGSVQAFSEISVAGCFWWGAHVAAAIRQTPAWLTEAGQRLGLEPQHHGDAVAWLAAAEILADGPQRLTAFLDVFQHIDKYKTTSTGVGRRFGTLLRQAAKLEELGHAAPAMALRQYLVKHYAGGHLSGKVCLFQKPKNRSILQKCAWIPQTQAAKMLGLRHGAVARLVQEGILEGHLHPAGQRGRSVGLVLRDSVETLQRELQNAFDVRATARRLGIDRHRVLDLIHSRVFCRVVRTDKGWLIPRASVADLENFCQRMPASKPASGGWLSLHEATRLFGPTGLTLALLFELIRAKKVSARMADPKERLDGILVSDADLSALAPEIRSQRDQERGYPVHHLGNALFPGRPIKCSVMKKWIAARLLKARKSGRARTVSPEEVERFRLEYCLAEEACHILGITRSTLSRWEVEGLLQPVYGKRVTPGAGFSLYRRADLAGLSRRRRRAA